MRAKIATDSYRDFKNKRRTEDVLHFYNISRYSFDEIKDNLIPPTDASGQNFRHLSEKTLTVFLEAEPLFKEYVRACSATDEIAKILCKSIRHFYNNKKSEMLYNDPYKDPWYFAAEASDGSWSTVLYSVTIPHTTQFSPEGMHDFINSVATRFNKCVGGFDATCGDRLKREIKAQFRVNCFEYLLRGVYAFYNTPSSEGDNLANAIFEYAQKTSDCFESQPSK